jgi:NADPH:quinone reductase-like Zn-dependent oxidoreductase
MPAVPKAGEIMVKVSYAAINPADLDFMGMSIPFRRNAIPAMDFVGDVVHTGPLSSSTNAAAPSSSIPRGVSTLGTTVAGSVPLTKALRGVGALAEYLTLPAHAVVRRPDGMDDTVATGLMGIAGQTSVALLRSAKLRDGDRVLVNGASGGVGSILVQVLSAMGIHVTGICSGKNAALVRKLGAKEVRFCLLPFFGGGLILDYAL